MRNPEKTVAKIDKLIERLEQICSDFDEVTDDLAALDWHEACRLGCYPDKVRDSIKVLRKMQAYYKTQI